MDSKILNWLLGILLVFSIAISVCMILSINKAKKIEYQAKLVLTTAEQIKRDAQASGEASGKKAAERIVSDADKKAKQILDRVKQIERNADKKLSQAIMMAKNIQKKAEIRHDELIAKAHTKAEEIIKQAKASNQSDTESPLASSTSSDIKESRPTVINKSVKVGYWSYVVHGYLYTIVKSKDLNQNKIYLSIMVTATNNDQSASMIPSFYLTDQKQNRYDNCSNFEVYDIFGDALLKTENLNPGISRQGLIVFELNEARDYNLVLSGGLLSSEETTIAIQLPK